MMRSTARIATDQAANYLSLLCGDLAARPALADDAVVHIDFPFGACALAAQDQGLCLEVEAENVLDLGRMEKIIGDRLGRVMPGAPADLPWRWN